METYVTITLVCVVLFILFLLKEYFDSKRARKKCLEKVNKDYGKLSKKTLSADELENIKKLFYRYLSKDSIDDITAADLELDDIFIKFNVSLSAPGAAYFYYLLRTPEYDDEKINALEEKINFFKGKPEEANKLRAWFYSIGEMKKVNFFDCLDYFDTIDRRKPVKEILLFFAFLIGILCLFVYVPVGVLFLILSLVYAIIDYYKERGTIEPYIICFSYMVNFIKASKEISKINCPAIEAEVNRLKELCEELKGFEKHSGIVTKGARIGTGAGNPLDILSDYLKMLFHIDIVRFYQMLNVVRDKKDLIEEVYIILGKIETYVTIASLREAYKDYCIPKTGKGIKGLNIYHPLIYEPVKNSIETKKGILVTGSNASGKSTFLKTVALNAIFSRTIHTCFGDAFSMEDYVIFSSMSLRDDLSNKDSYFMVEIKALKRIFDYSSNNPYRKVLCFVDEVLRGTNTVERIAACTQILKYLSKNNILCFAATHDIELTELLGDIYSNYHFDEDIIDDDVIFNYLLKEGKATSKNAIKLLSIMGFSDSIVDAAQAMATDFTNNGIWRG